MRVVAGASAFCVVLGVALAYCFLYFPSELETGARDARILSYSAEYDIDRRGVLEASETWRVDFARPRTGIRRVFDTVSPFDEHVRFTPRHIEATRDGRREELYRTDQNNERSIIVRTGDDDATMRGTHTFNLRYEVKGVLVPSLHGSGSSFAWRVLPGNVRDPVDAVTVRVRLPGAPSPAPRCDVAGAPTGCTVDRRGDAVTVTAGALPSRTPVDLDVGSDVPPPGTVDRAPWPARWTPVLGRSALVLVAVGVATLGVFVAGVVFQYRTRRRTLAFPLRYDPPEGIGPAQGAYIVDFRVTPEMLAASVLQMSRQGVVRLTTSPAGWEASAVAGADWSVVDEVTAQIARQLGLLGRGPAPATLRLGEEDTEQALRHAVVGLRGTLNRWARGAGLVGWSSARFQVAQSVPLVAFLALVLAAINPVAMSVLALPVAAWAMATSPLLSFSATAFRTSAGDQLAVAVGGFRRTLVTDSAQERYAFAGRRELVDRYLPWAVVFGVADSWAQRLGEPPDLAAEWPELLDSEELTDELPGLAEGFNQILLRVVGRGRDGRHSK